MQARFISSQSAILRSFSCLTLALNGKHGLWAEVYVFRGLTPHAVKITGGVTTRLQPMEAKNMVCLLSTKE